MKILNATIEDGFVQFDISDSDYSTAYIQFPINCDCVHYIDNDQFDEDIEEHQEILDKCIDYYNNDVCGGDLEVAAATAICGGLVDKVVKVSGVSDFYVAFTDNLTFVMKENSYKNYTGNAYLFDFVDDYDDVNEEEIIKKAKQQL